MPVLAVIDPHVIQGCRFRRAGQVLAAEDSDSVLALPLSGGHARHVPRCGGHSVLGLVLSPRLGVEAVAPQIVSDGVRRTHLLDTTSENVQVTIHLRRAVVVPSVGSDARWVSHCPLVGLEVVEPQLVVVGVRVRINGVEAAALVQVSPAEESQELFAVLLPREQLARGAPAGGARKALELRPSDGGGEALLHLLLGLPLQRGIHQGEVVHVRLQFFSQGLQWDRPHIR
mmetsp:Transcript_49760/g.105980  ORF Transcript_49760/g.105980 Transcript_49760/m.105980 type:complete len:229 (+) Transcript_49760:318-1004(+)